MVARVGTCQHKANKPQWGQRCPSIHRQHIPPKTPSLQGVNHPMKVLINSRSLQIFKISNFKRKIKSRGCKCLNPQWIKNHQNLIKRDEIQWKVLNFNTESTNAIQVLLRNLSNLRNLGDINMATKFLQKKRHSNHESHQKFGTISKMMQIDDQKQAKHSSGDWENRERSTLQDLENAHQNSQSYRLHVRIREQLGKLGYDIRTRDKSLLKFPRKLIKIPDLERIEGVWKSFVLSFLKGFENPKTGQKNNIYIYIWKKKDLSFSFKLILFITFLINFI